MMGSGSAFNVLGDIARTKQRRSRRTPFDHGKRYYKDDGITHESPEVSTQVVTQIRERIQNEQQESRRKTMIILCIVGSIICLAMYYILFVHEFYSETPSIFQFGW